MGKYEFSLRQEVLLEKGASVLGDLFRFKRQHGITDQADPISVLYGLVWSAKQEILISETETELEQIEVPELAAFIKWTKAEQFPGQLQRPHMI